jgi:hypothetical protein
MTALAPTALVLLLINLLYSLTRYLGGAGHALMRAISLANTTAIHFMIFLLGQFFCQCAHMGLADQLTIHDEHDRIQLSFLLTLAVMVGTILA